MWGRMLSCARLLTALGGLLEPYKRVNNPQVDNLPHSYQRKHSGRCGRNSAARPWRAWSNSISIECREPSR
jgi:hypothetical protein